MCDFCHQHGEGRKWYLQAKNYSEDLLSDLRRRSYIRHFFEYPQELPGGIAKLDYLDKLPAFVQAAVAPLIVNRQKKTHFGQVLPIEEIESIFGFVNSVVRVNCVCRHLAIGGEHRYCYGLSLAPWPESELRKLLGSISAEYLNGPQSAGLEHMPKNEALESLRSLEQHGLCHTVWTFITPYIGGICNCDRQDCLAMQATIGKSVPVMFKAEYIARVDPYTCNGCRACMRACQFGAMGYSVATGRVFIEPNSCFGCGICRSQCSRQAIELVDRTAAAST